VGSVVRSLLTWGTELPQNPVYAEAVYEILELELRLTGHGFRTADTSLLQVP
jgi:hypothetical protein